MDAMRGKIDQLLETNLSLAKREDELRHATAAENDIPTLLSTSHLRPIVTNPRYGLSPDYTPPQMEDPIQLEPVHITVSNEIYDMQENPIIQA